MTDRWQELLIPKAASVREAMKQLDRTARKILFVVDADRRLAGSLSDGDVRRWILADGSLDAPVAAACYRKTYAVGEGYDVAEVEREIGRRKILIVPVLDGRRRVVGLIGGEGFVGAAAAKAPAPLSGPVVIMAGGRGERLDPFTRILPKALIPIGERTLIEIIFERFRAYRIDHFHVSVGPKAKVIKSYFEELAPPYRITFLEEAAPLGTAGALKKLEGTFKGSLVMTNCDVIVDAEYDDIERLHRRSGNDVTLVAAHRNFVLPYGLCEIEKGGRLKRIVEKPEYGFLVNAGLYFIRDRVLKLIPAGRPFDVTQLVAAVLAAKGKVGVYPVGQSAWIDTGEWSEYRNAIEKLKL